MTTADINRQQLIDWYYSTLNALATATPETRPAIEARLEGHPLPDRSPRLAPAG